MLQFFSCRMLDHYDRIVIRAIRRWSPPALRWSLSAVFVWFGALKIFGFNPVYEIVYASFPFFATASGNFILGVIEVAIGLGLLFSIAPRLVHLALLGHLAGTLTVFLSGPELMFDPYFPVLTLSGEFVFKNVVLAVSGLVIAGYSKNRFARAETAQANGASPEI